MVSSIERFHCIQDSQLGPKGVLYREVPLYSMHGCMHTSVQHALLKTHTDGCAHSRNEAEKPRYKAAESGKDNGDNETGDQGIEGELGGWRRLVVHHRVGWLGGHHLRLRGRRRSGW